MQDEKLFGAAEAILFSSGDPVSSERLGQVLSLEKEETEELMNALIEKYNTEFSGIQIFRLEGSYQMGSNPLYASFVRETLELKRNTPLSQAAMEVLAVVAYNQPVTKNFIEQIRGVDCSGVISSLMLKGLVEERGRLELPGRPLLYGTTSDFLRCLNISSLEELLPLSEKDKEEDREALSE